MSVIIMDPKHGLEMSTKMDKKKGWGEAHPLQAQLLCKTAGAVKIIML